MGKQKKRKTQHLSDAEIWDDSALIRSWDEAVAEYEYYHSIHAKGEDVEEVLRQAEMAEKIKLNATANINRNLANVSASASMNMDYEDGEIEHEDLEESMAPIGKGDEAAHESKDIAASPSAMNSNTRTTRSQPSATKGSTQALENIKMAYWWAGYYSGLYDGQQETTDTMTTQKQQET